MTPRWWSWLLVLALVAGAPGAAGAQLFFGSRPNPGFTIGPLLIRASVTPALGPVEVHVLWSVDLPPNRSATEFEQDLFLLWPGEVHGAPAGGKPEPALARYVEARGFSVVGEGRLPLEAQNLYAAEGEGKTESIADGAPFVTFVQESTAFGLSPPATWIRIPWTPRLANRTWLMDLRLRMPWLIKPTKAPFLESLFVGDRHQVSLSFNEVRDRPLFPMYLAHRDRVLHLADAPSELVVNFSHSDQLKIDQVFPPTSIQRLSETLDSTQVVSLFLGTGEGLLPQNLSVQFGYFSRLEGVALLAIPLLLLVLGPALGPLIGRLALRLADILSARIHVGGWSEQPRARQSGVILPRETVAQMVPGQSTRADVLRLCGPAIEEREEWAAPDRRVLVYRGQRQMPEARRIIGWFSAVRHWETEEHEVRVELEHDLVRDVQAQVRRYRLGAGKSA